MMNMNPIKAQNEVVSAFLEKWENSKNYLVEIAEIMSEANYNYKPTEREMNFQEQLLHIRNNMIWLTTTYFLVEGDKKFEKSDPQKKDEIIKELNLAFDYVTSVIKNTKEEDLTIKVEFFAGPKNKLQILNLLQDHVTHHRGQLIVYLNLNEITPPKYSGW